MKQNIIISLLVILICLFGFYIYNEYSTQKSSYTYAQPNYSSQKKTSSVKCQRYDVVQRVRKHLKGYNMNYNGLWKYWAEELSSNSSYKFDITQSGNTFVANASTVRRLPYDNESIVNVGTFTFLCSNNGKLTLSSAFGIFDD